jgi:hypothetical protein
MNMSDSTESGSGVKGRFSFFLVKEIDDLATGSEQP